MKIIPLIIVATIMAAISVYFFAKKDYSDGIYFAGLSFICVFTTLSVY